MKFRERTVDSEVGLQTDNSFKPKREQFRHAERSKKTDIQDSNSKKEERKDTQGQGGQQTATQAFK